MKAVEKIGYVLLICGGLLAIAAIITINPRHPDLVHGYTTMFVNRLPLLAKLEQAPKTEQCLETNKIVEGMLGTMVDKIHGEYFRFYLSTFTMLLGGLLTGIGAFRKT